VSSGLLVVPILVIGYPLHGHGLSLKGGTDSSISKTMGFLMDVKVKRA
jgi:hypothetical protein